MPKLASFAVIDDLARLCHGGGRETLKEALVAYSQAMKSPISRHSIEQWFAADPTSPTKGKSRFFLHAFLLAACDRTNLTADMTAVYDRLLTLLTKPPRQKKAVTADETGLSETALEYGKLLGGVLLDRTRRSDHSEVADFFYSSPQAPAAGERDHSYYLLYRYAATGRVVKAFLVCKRPQATIPSYSFLTFMRGDPQRYPEQHRESRGIITKWENNSYLFLGFVYRMASDDVDDPEKNVEVRRAAYEKPHYMEMLGFDFEEIDNRHGLFSGLTFTIAVSNPVITRVAMLHLGTVSSLGTSISHKEVGLKVLDSQDIAKDLRETVERLRRKKCKNFGRRLEVDSKASDWASVRSGEMADEILAMLDNTPAYESTLHEESRSKEFASRGAIGTTPRAYQQIQSLMGTRSKRSLT
jgi:hypothetical protein